jgi:hypothetical protein
MHEGQRATHPLSKLSDWAILCPEGRFGPDSVGELERLLERARNPGISTDHADCRTDRR